MRNYWLEKKEEQACSQDDDTLIDWSSRLGMTLDSVYPYQFIQNEVVRWDDCFHLEFTPVLENSVTGTIYRGDIPIQSFYVQDGLFIFTSFDNPSIIVYSGGSTIDYTTGEITLSWEWDWKVPVTSGKVNTHPYLVVSYEHMIN